MDAQSNAQNGRIVDAARRRTAAQINAVISHAPAGTRIETRRAADGGEYIVLTGPDAAQGVRE